MSRVFGICYLGGRVFGWRRWRVDIVVVVVAAAAAVVVTADAAFCGGVVAANAVAVVAFLQGPLEVEQLAHEGEVGGDVGLARLHVVVRLVQVHALLLHHVRHRHRHRAADTGQTVHKHALMGLNSFVWKTQTQKPINILEDK